MQKTDENPGGKGTRKNWGEKNRGDRTGTENKRTNRGILEGTKTREE